MDCKNRIIKLRESTGLNRKDFCKLVHIPYRTMTEWELDNRHAPDYVLRLLEYYIRNEGLMVKAGINKKALAKFGGEVYCFMSDEDVAKNAKSAGSTRAAASMEKAAKLGKPVIFAIGNAPTALVRLYELIQEKQIQPYLIIGVPVGFVNVVQSKEMIMETDVPCIVAKGRKGGSNIAACICNALLYMIDNERDYWK